MSESLSDALSKTTLKAAVLEAVASDSVDLPPTEFSELSRFVICSVRAVARRNDCTGLSVFVYSEAPLPEGRAYGFSRVMHMQDGHGVVSDRIILTGRDAHNGASKGCASNSIEGFFDEIERMGFGARPTVIWDTNSRYATVYPDGVTNDQAFLRFDVAVGNVELTQDEVCEVLNKAYNDNLKNPSGRTANLFTRGKLVANAEDEIERHLKGQIFMFFAGRDRPVRVLSQINTSAGRTDLLLIEKLNGGAPSLSGVIELKVLRGPEAKDYAATTEGLSQGYSYRKDLGLPFSTLALYDVNEAPSDDIDSLLLGQDEEHKAQVRVRRFPIFDSPKAWRDAGAPTAA